MELEVKILRLYIGVTSEIRKLEYSHAQEKSFEEGIRIQKEIEKREYLRSEIRNIW